MFFFQVLRSAAVPWGQDDRSQQTHATSLSQVPHSQLIPCVQQSVHTSGGFRSAEGQLINSMPLLLLMTMSYLKKLEKKCVQFWLTPNGKL